MNWNEYKDMVKETDPVGKEILGQLGLTLQVTPLPETK